MDPLGRDPLIRSFERYLYADNRSARTVTTYLIAVHRPTPSCANVAPAWRKPLRPTSRRSWPTCFLAGWPARLPPTQGPQDSLLGSSQLESLNWWPNATARTASCSLSMVQSRWVRLNRGPGTRPAAAPSPAGIPSGRGIESAARSTRVTPRCPGADHRPPASARRLRPACGTLVAIPAAARV
jgi:hypothetical protein